MSSKIEIVEKEIGHCIEIEELISTFKIPSALGRDYHTISEYISSEDAEMSDFPYVRYIDVDWEDQMSKGFFSNLIDVFTKKWHLQVGIPVSKELSSSNKVSYRFIENKKYIQTYHYGSYQKVSDTYRKMYNWAKEEGITLEGESIEIYTNSPQEVKKEDLETIVLIGIDSFDEKI